MNIRAECSNPKCFAFGIEKSVAVGRMLGYGAPNDRINCPICGQLMKTTQTINTTAKGRTKGRSKSMGTVSTRPRAGIRKRLRKRISKRS
jgi:hypothetical protein